VGCVERAKVFRRLRIGPVHKAPKELDDGDRLNLNEQIGEPERCHADQGAGGARVGVPGHLFGRCPGL
jgi:hypothetical protein